MASSPISRYSLPHPLRTPTSSAAGRNDSGHITVRHRGGGHKQAIRKIDWNRQSGFGTVIGFEYDPQRNTRLAKLYHPNNSGIVYSLIPAVKGIIPFQNVSVHSGSTQTAAIILQAGDSAPLSAFEAGDLIHAVQPFPNNRPLFARAAGTFCQVIAIEHQSDSQNNTGVAIIRRPSGSYRRVSLNARATVGRVSEDVTTNTIHNKAGRSRWLGRRPTVRGTARNPVDHPHGGNSRGRPSVTFKGWPTKGQPTRRSKRTASHILVAPTK